MQKIVDVKSRNEHLSNTLANRECILYKMHMAQKLWEQINLNIEEYYGKVNDEVRKTFQSLNTKMSNDEIVSNIVKLIKLLRR